MSKLKRRSWTVGEGGNDDVLIIELTKGKLVAIDMIDKDLAKFNWSASITDDKIYAVRKDPITGKNILIHRVIYERIKTSPLKKDYVVDHINGNTQINTRNNLRSSNTDFNAANSKRKSKKSTTSRYKGVYLNKEKNKWCAQIGILGDRINLGYYDNEEEAAKAYDKEAVLYNGPYAKLNFPNEDYALEKSKLNGSAKKR
jgi:hypothetical protein